MKSQSTDDWARLDNAGKIFPSNSNKRDTKVFRFACQLNEPVEQSTLQKALDITVQEFPLYNSCLRRGLFWYYLKPSRIPALVTQEHLPPCSSIYDANRYNLLFQVTYFKNRINFEVYHVLTDGTGALQFLRTLVYHYLCLHHAGELKGKLPHWDSDASFAQKAEDSFYKYYEKTKKKSTKIPNAYQIRGAKTAENRILILEGHTSVKQVLYQAHEYQTTMTGLLSAAFLCALHKNAPLSQQRKPIVLMVPVNLRNHFQSSSMRNFFCTVNIGYNFSTGPDDFESVIASINQQLKENLTKEQLAARMNGYSAIERNAFARITPLFLKDIVMKLAGKRNALKTTGSISNIGKVTMPPELEPYISYFDVFISTAKLQTCLCSFHDTLVISFTSAFQSTDVQKDFFRTLSAMGLPVKILSNEHFGGEATL